MVNDPAAESILGSNNFTILTTGSFFVDAKRSPGTVTYFITENGMSVGSFNPTCTELIRDLSSKEMACAVLHAGKIENQYCEDGKKTVICDDWVFVHGREG